MLKSMTGHGRAMAEQHGYRVVAELRCVNSRYFKLHLRSMERYGGLEQPVEALVRSVVQRGSINATLNISAPGPSVSAELDVDLLRHYATQISNVAAELKLESGASIVDLMQLPGVIIESTCEIPDEKLLWPAVETAVTDALRSLEEMRLVEGEAMKADFEKNLQAMDQFVQAIQLRAPEVVKEYHVRLRDRVRQFMSGQTEKIAGDDLAREVVLFADRCDITEELVRLRSHIDQFRDVLQVELPSGKKLEFIIQEMFRETNTIGSKASDLEVSKNMIELKTTIERMREMVQNVE